jgi:hypothetical protein
MENLPGFSPGQQLMGEPCSGSGSGACRTGRQNSPHARQAGGRTRSKGCAGPAAAKADMQTFVCKDGSTMSAASSKGACSGRKGIDQQATAKAAAGAKPAATAAPGGGAGKVWANEDSKIYHCPGTRFYGTTKNGKYMSEADAKAAGMHGANNKSCS